MLFNWYYDKENAMAMPIINALQRGLQNEMQVLVPSEMPAAFLSMVSDPAKSRLEIHLQPRSP